MGKTGNFSRRGFFKTVAFGAILGFSGPVSEVFGAEALDYEHLRVTLYPKTEEERAYLKSVVALVKEKKIPDKIVYSAWKYANKKQKVVRVRYFAETLVILCKRNRVSFSLKTPKEDF